MRGIGHQGSLPIEQGAGKIKPFADVHRAAGLTEPLSHPFRDLHETVMEQAQIHRIGPLVEGRLATRTDRHHRSHWHRPVRLQQQAAVLQSSA